MYYFLHSTVSGAVLLHAGSPYSGQSALDPLCDLSATQQQQGPEEQHQQPPAQLLQAAWTYNRI